MKNKCFIGLGVMGYPLAGHISQGGYKVSVFNRSKEKSKAWILDYSGRLAGSPAEAAEGCDMAFLCVGKDSDVEEVVLGENSLLESICKGGIIIDHTTTSAKIARKLEKECLMHIIKTSCAIKAKVVEKDERESHYRMILNFGHTLGHAIEAITGYSKFIHGEAVAIGMVYAAKLSHQLGKCSQEIPEQIMKLVKKCGLPVDLPDLDPQMIIESLYHDKKTMNNKIKFILVREIGEIEIVNDMPEKDIRKLL